MRPFEAEKLDPPYWRRFRVNERVMLASLNMNWLVSTKHRSSLQPICDLLIPNSAL